MSVVSPIPPRSARRRGAHGSSIRRSMGTCSKSTDIFGAIELMNMKMNLEIHIRFEETSIDTQTIFGVHLIWMLKNGLEFQAQKASRPLLLITRPSIGRFAGHISKCIFHGHHGSPELGVPQKENISVPQGPRRRLLASGRGSKEL